MSSFQRTRAEASFAALHRAAPLPAPVTDPAIKLAATTSGFDRLKAELATKRANAKLVAEGE